MKGSVAIKDFADGAKARGIDGPAKWFQETLRNVAIAIDAEMGQSEGSKQPGPDGALMISGVALANAATAVAFVRWVGTGETAQSV